MDKRMTRLGGECKDLAVERLPAADTKSQPSPTLKCNSGMKWTIRKDYMTARPLDYAVRQPVVSERQLTTELC